MNEQQTVANNPVYIQAESSILEDPYQKEVQEDIWQHEKKKTMHSLFSIGFILLVATIIGYASVNALDSVYLFEIILYPVIFLGLGLFAKLQPMISVIVGIIVILAITVISYLTLGAISLIAGWLYKVIALYFIIKSVTHAIEAEKARKQLQQLG